MIAASPLSLADLESFDPTAVDRGRERRFLCPNCGGDKPRDAAHRSLTANVETGAWHCHRCGARGKLRDRWDASPKLRRDIIRAKTRRAFSLPATEVVPVNVRPWRKALQPMQPLAGTPGEAYLAGRGIPCEIADAAGCRFLESWYGRPAVLFPIRDRQGKLVAAHGRYLRDDVKPSKRTVGVKALGAFATAGAWDAGPLILCEAPIDALSLAVCGRPALAVCGCNLPDWLAWTCAFRDVLIATDADEPGDEAAIALETALRSRGGGSQRLRPRQDANDWNGWLRQDPTSLRVFLGGEPVVAAPAPDPRDWSTATIGTLMDAATESGATFTLAGSEVMVTHADTLPPALAAEIALRQRGLLLYLIHERDGEAGLTAFLVREREPVVAEVESLFEDETEDEAPEMVEAAPRSGAMTHTAAIEPPTTAGREETRQ